MSGSRPHREYPAALLAEAIERIVYGGQSISAVARELDIADATLRRRIELHYGDQRRKEAIDRVRAGESPAAAAKVLHTKPEKIEAWLEEFYDQNPEAYHVDHAHDRNDPPGEGDHHTSAAPMREVPDELPDELTQPQLSKVDQVLLDWLGPAAEDGGSCPAISPHPLSARPNAAHIRWASQVPDRFRVELYTCPDHPVSYELGAVGGRYQLRRTRFTWASGESAMAVDYSTLVYSRAEVDTLWWQLLIGLAR